ncbi:MAG: hypothetical protein ABI177_07430 [Edaphobacter sp.]
MSEMFAEPVASAISRQERSALLERVASSQHFKRAARLREFLLYVGQSSIENSGATIHEQEVGTTVFGRQAGYDTSLDNIVRVNATELRKRLELYFVTEGSEEPVVIEIPRGSYTTIFRPRVVTNERPLEQEVPLVEEAVAVPATDEIVKTSTRVTPVAWRSYLPWIFSVLLLGACVYLSWQNARLESTLSPWKSNPALRMFWSRFLDSGQPTDVVVADTSFAVAEDIASRTISLGDYLSYGYKRLAEDPAISPDRRADLGLVLERNNGSVGDFIVARRILALDPTAAALQLNFARDYSPEAIKTNSVILIGSEQSNPWVELFKDRLNFSMEYDPTEHRPFVRNRNPKPGEQSVYNGTSDPARNEGYSIVAFLPDLSRNGNALIIAGTDSQATRSAGEFVTNGDSLETLRNKLGAHNGFPYFEVLLHNMQITGTPLRSEILAFRNEGQVGLPEASHGASH